MTYTKAIEKLREKGFRPVTHISKGLKEERILRLEVYASPILKDDKAREIKGLVGDNYNVYGIGDAIFIEREK